MEVHAVNFYRDNVIKFRGKNDSPFSNAVEVVNLLDTLGFHRDDEQNYFDFLYSEIEEFKEAKNNGNFTNMKEEMGDILFDAVMLANYYGINSEQALKMTSAKLKKRVITAQLLADKNLLEYPLKTRLEYWAKAKEILKEQEKKSYIA